MTVEIQTMEGGRLEWVAVFASTRPEDAIRRGDQVLAGFNHAPNKPRLRLLDGRLGNVIGAWQAEGYEVSS